MNKIIGITFLSLYTSTITNSTRIKLLKNELISKFKYLILNFTVFETFVKSGEIFKFLETLILD